MYFNAIRENKSSRNFQSNSFYHSRSLLDMTVALLTGLSKIITNKQCVELINKYKCINSEHGEYM